MKLTKAQQTVVDLMNDGWELGVSSTFDSHIRLQKGGLGRGGDVKPVHANTFNSLSIKGIIKQDKYGFPTSKWKLA